MLLGATLATPAASAQEGLFHGEIEVGRVLTEVRVVDPGGSAVLGLKASDFQVSIGGVPVIVESADWIASPPITLDGSDAARVTSAGHDLTPDQAPGSRRTAAAVPEPSATEPSATGPSATEPSATEPSARSSGPAGRTIVLLVQIGFEDVRLTGLYRMSAQAIRLVRGLGPADRVALVVYDRHLTLQSDLTSDLEHIEHLLAVPRLVQWDHDLRRRSEPSLVDTFDVAAAEDAATMQQGLRVLARALEPIPGPKTVIFLGWGMGRFGSSGVVLGSAYGEAKLSLARARATVFSLDITNAEMHTLEVGLRAVAEDTGGFYVKTHLFPELATRRLARAMEGHYELSLIPPPGLEGFTSLQARVSIPGMNATVLSRPLVRLGAPARAAEPQAAAEPR